jgi:phosphate starvation-inducible protein PhoH and related proteins
MARRKISQKPNNNRKQQKRERFEDSLRIKDVYPKTENQKRIFSLYRQNKNLMIHGLPGTGKTYLSMYLSLSDIISGHYDKIIIFRSAVATRDIGFLPGSAKDKVKEFEAPYSEICSKLFDRDDIYHLLKMRKMVEFRPTSFIRGITFDNAIIIVDEVQNLNDHEVSSVITRMGNNSKIIMCGDFRQSDFVTKGAEESGIKNLFKTTKLMPSFSHVELGIDDIVRSGIVKEYIQARYELGLL